MAGSLGQLILFRVVQGLAGGGLQPGSQGVLLDAFPREKQGVAMTLFGFAVLIAPVVGPTLGGWITDYLLVALGLPDQRARRHRGARRMLHPSSRSGLSRRRAAGVEKAAFPFRLDRPVAAGVVMVSWEVVLSKGQEWDWFGDPFWRVQTLAIVLGSAWLR